MTDMYENDLDISIQKKLITYKNLKQDLAFENFFIIHKWKPGDMEYYLYSEEDLQLHRVFGHPSVAALHNLLRRADPSRQHVNVKNTIKKILTNAKHA